LLTTVIIKKYSIGFFFIALIVTLSGALFSFLIEFLQLFLPTRNSGLSDIFSNILGNVFGMLVVLTVKSR
jgi:VanZ family protein